MRINLPRLDRTVRRLLARRHVALTERAQRSWTLCPKESAVAPPAIHLPGTLDHVVALSPWRDWNTEKGLIDGGAVEHAASRAFAIKNVELVDAWLYAGPAKSLSGFGAERWLHRDLPQRQVFDQAALVTNFSGSHFFGNRLLDDFPLALLADPSLPPVAMVTRPYGHEAGYRALCGLAGDAPIRRASVRELVVYEDFAQNSSKAERYRELRRRVRASLGGTVAAAPPGVFIRRGPDGEPRHLLNTAQVEATLAAAGFSIIDTTQLSAREIAERSLNARIVVGVEGSHFSHAIYTAADQATFFVLQPPDRFAMAYKEYTDRMDMRFAFLVGRPGEGGFTIDLDELHRMLDLLAASDRAS